MVLNSIFDVFRNIFFSISSEKTLKNHMEYIHPKEEEPKFKCAECDKTFRIEAGYKLHMQNHEAEREALTNKYVCDGKINC